MDSKKIFTLALIIVVSLLMIFVQFNSFRNGGSTLPERVTADALSPAQSFFSDVGRRISGLWSSLTIGSKLEEENKKLRAELYTLREEQENFNRTREENKQLRKLLDISEMQRGTVIAAQVIGRDPDNWFQSISLNKGFKNGVSKNMVAITSEGLVGRVLSVSEYTCKVRFIFSEKSAVPAQLVSTGELGVVYGEGKNTCVMRYISAEAKVNIGDQVITSNLGRIYPPGKIIGQVSKLYGRDQLLYQAVQLKPAVQIGNLEYVLLIERK
jgi:rod shape-determining protein MreC